MSESEFWNSTPRYYSARVKAASEAQQREWERARLISFFVVKTVDSKDKFKQPQNLMEFPWETNEKAKTLEEQWNALDPEVIRRFNQDSDKILTHGFNSGT